MIKDITVDSSLRGLLDKGEAAAKSGEKAGNESFDNVLRDTISDVNQLQKEAEVATGELLKGSASIHETILSIEKADLSFRFMMKVRNKILDAYQEVMRMQV